MIYGYGRRTLNEYGLNEMREISISISAPRLRKLAEYLIQSASELDRAGGHWHKHAPAALAREIGCDVIVLPEEGSGEKEDQGRNAV
jgi:hypothetical protein